MFASTGHGATYNAFVRARTDIHQDVVKRTLFYLTKRTITYCAAEGIHGAHVRKKDTKYTPLVNDINETKMWEASLFTLEIGARGLVASSSHRIFVMLGLSSSQARSLCKTLSLVARCSYAIYLAHNSLAWSHGNDLIVEESFAKTPVETKSEGKPVAQNLLPKNIVVLRENGVQKLYHFTDVSNLDSIREHGLLAWRKIESEKLIAR